RAQASAALADVGTVPASNHQPAVPGPTSIVIWAIGIPKHRLRQADVASIGARERPGRQHVCLLQSKTTDQRFEFGGGVAGCDDNVATLDAVPCGPDHNSVRPRSA